MKPFGGEGVHRVTVGVHLPVGSRGRQFAGERQNVLDRRHGIGPAVKDQHAGADRPLRPPGWRLQSAMDADHTLQTAGVRPGQVEHAQAAEAVAERGDPVGID